MAAILQSFLGAGVYAGTQEVVGGPAADPEDPAITSTDNTAVDPTPLTGGAQATALALSNGTGVGSRALQFDGNPIAEPQRTYDFRVWLPPIGVTTPLVEGIDVNIVEATTPSPEPIGGRHRYIAGTYDAAPLSLILYHNQTSDGVVGHIARDYLHYWQRLVQNDDGTYNYPETYLFPIFIDFRNVNQTVGYTIEYRKCFPLTVSPVPMRFNRSDRTAITVTFSCERVIRTLGSGNSGTTNGIAITNSQIETPFDQASFQAGGGTANEINT
jgi:hypothetical protein